MSANIFGKRFAERNGYAWHGLGTRLEGVGTSATEALAVSGLDYGVEKRALWYYGADGAPAASTYDAVVRPAWQDEPETLLGVVGREYTPLQNGELCKLLDPLTDEWPVETIGGLGKGETIFLTLNAGTATVGGDDLKQFFFVMNSHDGTGALRINITPVRVVCANTCVTGLAQASVQASVVHTRRVMQEAEFAINLVAQLRRGQAAAIAALDGLTRIKVSAEQVARIVEAVYPERPTPQRLQALEAHNSGDLSLSDDRIAELMNVSLNLEQSRERALKLRLAVFDRFMAFNDARPDVANTAWATYNAVTETECWREGGTDAQAGRSILLGERGQKMAAAFRLLSALPA